MSHASKTRLSQYSTTSIPTRSRPPSHIFPIYPSSLPYTLVRDFAYPAVHPLHYGPPPEPSRPPSGMTTPASEQRRLSDPPTSWDSQPWGDGWAKIHDLPAMQFADGPPWSEDDDLQSPVVSSRHRKHKSSGGAFGHGRHRSREGAPSTQQGSILNPNNFDRERGYYAGTGGDAVPLLPVVALPQGKTVETPGVRRDLARVDATLAKALPGARIASYASTGDRTFVSKDGRTVYALVYPTGADASD